MVGIVCFWDRYATPYLTKYENLLQEQGVDYEVIFWNRLTEPAETTITQEEGEKYVYINQYCKMGLKKITSFLLWRLKVIKVLKSKKYSHLILLSTMPAVLTMDYILKNYQNNYIFDIRDYTLEANFIFRKLVMRVIRHSCLTPISSRGYLTWLEPSEKIMVNHNITIGESHEFEAPSFSDGKIRFSFVGNIRLDTQTRAMLILLGKSERIEQHYYGRILPNCDIEEIIKNEGLTNVYLHGPFIKEDKLKIYQDTDMINTVYVNAEHEKDIPLGDSTPLPNRLYDALVFYRPLITSKGTYLAKLSDKYHLGVNINGFDSNIESQILDYVNNFNKVEFAKGCDELKHIVMKEESDFIDEINSIFKNWE